MKFGEPVLPKPEPKSEAYDRLSDQMRASNERTAQRLSQLSEEIAVLKYAQGVEARMMPKEELG